LKDADAFCGVNYDSRVSNLKLSGLSYRLWTRNWYIIIWSGYGI